MTSVLLLLLTAVPAVTEYDAFGDSAHRASPATYSPAAKRRIEAGFISQEEPRLGVPTFFWAPRPAEEATALRELGLTPEQAARRWLFVYGELYRQNAADLAGQHLEDVHDLGDGAVIVRFSKVSHGLPVFRDTLNVVMTQGLQLVALSGYLSPHEANPDFKLAAGTALAVAWRDVTGEVLDPQRFGAPRPSEGGWQKLGSARARKVLYPLPEGLVGAWQLELTVARTDGTDEGISCVVSADDGRLLMRHDLTADASYRVWADTAAPFIPWDGPQGITPTPSPTALLDGYQPPNVPSQLVSVTSVLPVADPWLAPTANTLAGNNIEAYADLVAPDGFNADGGDLLVPSSAAGVFDYAYDFTQNANAAQTQRFAAATQAFFTTNWAHDVLYLQGFDEKARNGQKSNFGRGGLQNDFVRVEVHDFSARNNASMRTPADGEPGRLQALLFDSTGPSLIALTQDGGPLDAGLFAAGPAFIGPQAFDFTGEVVYGYDGVDAGHDGCEGPLLNAADVTGKIVLFETPKCPYASAGFVGADAGAVGVLITHSNQGLIEIAGPPGAVVPPMFLLQRDAGLQLAAVLDAGIAVQARMYRPPVIERDASLDNGVLAHEYAHFLTGRIIGDSNGLLNQSARSLGEGWSDVFALWMLLREDDGLVPSNAGFKGTYAVGAHARAGTLFSGAGNPAFYLGFRRYPYSANFAKNGLTFKHIQLGQALPAVPGAPTNDNTEVHNAGEVWASALWEGYVAMLNVTRYPYAVARERMLQYLVASLKVTPVLPTYLEARDAFLSVVAAKDPLDLLLWTQAFARRGMGFKATGPARFSTDNKPVVEDFGSTGNFVKVTSAVIDDQPGYCDKDGILDVGEQGTLKLSVLNVGAGALSSTTALVTTTAAGVVFGNNGVATFAPMGSFAAAAGTVPIRLTAATGPLSIPLTITVNDPSLLNGNFVTTLTALANIDAVPATVEHCEANPDVWSADLDGPRAGYEDLMLARDTGTPGQKEFTGPDVPYLADTTLTSPSLEVGTGPLTMTFKHRWQFENLMSRSYDGAILEFSADDGSTWGPVPSAALTPPYNGTIYAQSQATLRGENAFVDTSPGYPAMVSQTVAFGTAYAGKRVKVRFHISTDPSGGAPGWAVDDVAFTGLTNKPFFDNVADQKVCVNRPPVITLMADRTVDERTTVNLAPAATDPDGQTPTLTWAQLSGPMVALTGNTFVAPEVTPAANTVLVFELTASDGTLSSKATATVNVKNVNRPPVARAGDAQKVKVGAAVTLEASAVDPDGDAVTFVWTQTAGPLPELTGDKTAKLSFTAPSVAMATTLTFEVVASDGASTSGPSSVDVVIEPAGGGGCGCGTTAPAVFFPLALLWFVAYRRRWASASHALRR